MSRLEDVARAAGVSKATASRAFVHPELVAEPTRKRVLDAATALRFEPNRAARALTTGRSGLIGLIVPTLANPFFAPLLAGAQRGAEDIGGNLLVTVSDHSAQREARLFERLAEQVDGFIVVTPLSANETIRRLSQARPVILIDRKVPRVPSVVIDTVGGVGILVEHLLQLGHERIAYVAGPPGSWVDTQRRRELTARLARVGASPVVLSPLPPTFDAGITAAAQLPAGVTAVIVYNSYVALGLLHALAAAGVRVPEDLSLASLDDLIPLGSTTPAITALEVPLDEAGRVAITHLHSAIAGERPRSTTLPTRLLVRASTIARPSPQRASTERG
ncbi:MAG: LacI family transcriptional regulator [Pseudonocardiales bacterium]|nr:LacI family transcriptional regulator [Pseudonocardiales bacterium]